jgi:hypothetical protein
MLPNTNIPNVTAPTGIETTKPAPCTAFEERNETFFCRSNHALFWLLMFSRNSSDLMSSGQAGRHGSWVSDGRRKNCARNAGRVPDKNEDMEDEDKTRVLGITPNTTWLAVRSGKAETLDPADQDLFRPSDPGYFRTYPKADVCVETASKSTPHTRAHELHKRWRSASSSRLLQVSHENTRYYIL